MSSAPNRLVAALDLGTTKVAAIIAEAQGDPRYGGDTEFADMRAAYDALSAAMKARLEGLRVRHSIAYSRQTLGFEFSAEEAKRLPGAEHPLVRTLPRAGRKSLYEQPYW